MKAVFLFDLDNTLLDDHRFVGDFKAYLKRVFGLRKTNEFFRLVEKRKRRVGFADYLGTLERYAMKHPREKNLVPVARFLAEYPFSNRLFPGAISVLRALRRDGGIPVLFTEGNLMFQTLKINNAGLRAV